MSRDSRSRVGSTKKRNFFEAFSPVSKPKSGNDKAKHPPGKKQTLQSTPTVKESPAGISRSASSVKETSIVYDDNELAGTPRDSICETEEEESTDFKLALLSSLQPSLSPETLLELLLTCSGSVEEASKLATSKNISGPSSKRPSTAITTQSSLSTYLSDNQGISGIGDVTSSRPIPFPLPPVPKSQTIHLTTPSQVPYHAPATLHPSFLPTSIANQLLNECLNEVPSFGKYEFRLFERNVSSPHTAAFYVKDEEMATKHRGGYMYNGSYLDDIRTFTPTMLSVIPLVESHVNAAINSRIETVYPDGRKLKHMLPANAWRITSAFMNCYDGAKQSVGWHSDQLTYLGPRTIIASISLGVEREFRLRRVAPVVLDPEDPEEAINGGTMITDATTGEKKWKWEPEGQLSIHLPHNSLLIMHAECQESWKHSVHPANNIQPHPIAGGKRINITFRCYRDTLGPEVIPRCKCGVGCVLKTVQRVKDKMGWYFWGCQVGNQWREGEQDEKKLNDGSTGKSVEEKGKSKEEKPGEGCGYLQWARFTEDGDPIWE
ncbi:hypothetical protein ABW19_dt0201140 [Dactylella cylindrospora]|nr:hypothetical protein ABW19_dt0201140 [Dactylella cylindrospora]